MKHSQSKQKKKSQNFIHQEDIDQKKLSLNIKNPQSENNNKIEKQISKENDEQQTQNVTQGNGFVILDYKPFDDFILIKNKDKNLMIKQNFKDRQICPISSPKYQMMDIQIQGKQKNQNNLSQNLQTKQGRQMKLSTDFRKSISPFLTQVNRRRILQNEFQGYLDNLQPQRKQVHMKYLSRHKNQRQHLQMSHENFQKHHQMRVLKVVPKTFDQFGKRVGKRV